MVRMVSFMLFEFYKKKKAFQGSRIRHSTFTGLGSFHATALLHCRNSGLGGQCEASLALSVHTVPRGCAWTWTSALRVYYSRVHSFTCWLTAVWPQYPEKAAAGHLWGPRICRGSKVSFGAGLWAAGPSGSGRLACHCACAALCPASLTGTPALDAGSWVDAQSLRHTGQAGVNIFNKMCIMRGFLQSIWQGES